MKNTLKIVAITLISFGLYYFCCEFFFSIIYKYLTDSLKIKTISFFLTYLIIGTLLFLGVFLIHKRNIFFESLGIGKNLLKGIIIALICTIPMLIGYFIVFEFNTQITWNKIFIGAFSAAFFEELYFRGVLFGQIYRFTKIGFIPAILIGALLFAAGHLYQSLEMATLIGIFITTFLGAILFAWAYIEWKNNLWIPIFLHLFMNLFWMLFSAGENALGGIYSNAFRVLTIAMIIVGTILYKKKKGLKLEVNRKTIWMKS
ncbi:MAG: CPBP family intramembrane metalloprotease [Candidatus Cloacimonetes bacterium]|nr:CPBP family intramembrane metalloprotease [Candidatus Cloacimonadota bacterium]